MAYTPFSRKNLKAMGIEDDRIEPLMEAHLAVVDALKLERDQYKAEAEKLPEIQKQLEEEQKKTSGGEDWKKKYETLKSEIDTAKTLDAKTGLYRAALKSAGVADSYINLLVKANREDIEKLETDDGKIKDEDKYVEGLKTSMADYIPTTHTKGSHVSKPPKNTGGGLTRDEIMAIKDDTERQQAIAENMDLFQ